MVRTFNGKLLTFGNRVLRISSTYLFDVTGLITVDNIGFTFSSAVTVLVDFSDGTGIHSYATAGGTNQFTLANTNNTAAGQYAYTYQDGKPSTYRRTIKIIILDKSKVTTFTWRGVSTTPKNQTLKINFAELLSLATITLSASYLLNIDDSIAQSKSITGLRFGVLSFTADSQYNGIIPLSLLINKMYTLLTYSLNLGGISFSDSNVDKIAPNLKTTLASLDFTSAGFGDTNGTDGPLPANFADLTKLTTFTIALNNYTAPPPILNSITSLLSLSLQGNPLTTWGDLSALVNISSLNYSSITTLPTTVPAWFNNFTKLKTLNLGRFSVGNSARLDALITSLYGFWDTYGPKTGPNTQQYRAVTLTLSGSATDGLSDIPGGTYQQPSGYVAGSSNGTPASSLERLWVMANQYACIITYRSS